MKILDINTFRCPQCRMPYHPEHKCLCRLKSNLTVPGSNTRSIAILIALFAMAMAVVTAIGLWQAF